jgi:multiple sugar transport system ATP-binding protein
MANIVLDRLSKRFSNGFVAVRDLSLDIADGEFLVLVGPSGCGKTTALRMIAGLEAVTAGEVYLDGEQITDVPEKDRDMAMVFQNYALYPHMTVAENIGFSLKLAGLPRAEIRSRVADTAALLALDGLLDRRPKQLSGGQRQRVAMGRAIVRHPKAFLMDEPLSNLDAKLRVHMRGEIAALQKRLGVTTVYVTHDQIEAMTMGDRVAVIHEGALHQVDTPDRIYDRPANLFVAGFIGSPPMNLVHARIERTEGGLDAVLGSVRVGLSSEVVAERGLDAWVGRDVIVGIRPEDVEPADAGGDISAEVDRVEAVGASLLVHVRTDARPVITAGLTTEKGDDLDAVLLSGREGATICASFEPRSWVHAHDVVHVTLPPARLHFFDPGSEDAIWAMPVDPHTGPALS